MRLKNRCLQKSLLLFLVFFFLLSLTQQKLLASGECSEEKILQSKPFQVCLSQLESCAQGYDRLQKEVAASRRDKILFFIDAENAGYFGIGLLMGVFIL